jgi:hypothetical protein
VIPAAERLLCKHKVQNPSPTKKKKRKQASSWCKLSCLASPAPGAVFVSNVEAAESRGWRLLYLSEAFNIFLSFKFALNRNCQKLCLINLQPGEEVAHPSLLMISAKDNTQQWVNCQGG